MPIRINLLAEHHALEEERRRDPVKRAYLAAGLILSLVLLWSGLLKFQIMSSQGELDGLKAQWGTMKTSYERAKEQQMKVIAAEQKLNALQTLVTNRFRWGTTLNALQNTVVGVADIRVVHLKCAQTYSRSEEVKSTTKNGVTIPAKPALATERISLLIDAIDSSAQPGGNVNKFKETISQVPYFKENLKQTNGVLLTSLSAPQVAPNGRQPFVTFSIQCYFPEKVR